MRGERGKMKTTIVRNIPDSVHLEFRRALDSNESINGAIIGLMGLRSILGSPREAALDGLSFTLEPHCTNDSQDTPDSWVWRVQVKDETGKTVDSHLV